jgi:hypothetical protein
LSSERVERRLTAILAADVAAYSRLTGLDEEGTHAQLQDHLRFLVDPKIAEHPQLRRMNPTLSISSIEDFLPFRRPEDLARYEEGLRKAGLPE